MPVLCIDFDGTLVEHDYPRIGALRPNVIEVLTRFKKEGFRLILLTCREDGDEPGRDYLTQAVEFMRGHRIEFDAVNEPLSFEEEGGWRPTKLRRKPHGNVFIDDRNLGGIPFDWLDIYKQVHKQLRLGNPVENLR